MPSTNTKIIGVPWSLKSVWNTCLDEQKDRPLIARDYLYASELGQPFCDRYLKMNAVPFSNPNNKRSHRKFLAGHLWEWTIGMVFIAAGIFQKKQVRVKTQPKNCLMVSGKLDFVVGGKFDYEAAKKMVKSIEEALSLVNMDLPPFFFKAADNFIEKYRGQHLQEVIYEAKSVSERMFEKVAKSGPMDHHILQNYHYVKGNDVGIIGGKLGYLSKADCLMDEFDIEESSVVTKAYLADIKEMTAYYNEGFDRRNPLKFLPPKEPEVNFERGTWRFVPNWKIAYSNYLTYIYGYETADDFGKHKWQPKTSSWNRVFKRCVKEEKMTDSNLTYIAEAKNLGFAWDKYVLLARKNGAFQKDENEEE